MFIVQYYVLYLVTSVKACCEISTLCLSGALSVPMVAMVQTIIHMPLDLQLSWLDFNKLN